MFYYLKIYSYDADRPVVGPFKDASACFDAMQEEGDAIYEQVRRAGVGYLCSIDSDPVLGMVTVTDDVAGSIPDKTMLAMFQMDESA